MPGDSVKLYAPKVMRRHIPPPEADRYSAGEFQPPGPALGTAEWISQLLEAVSVPIPEEVKLGAEEQAEWAQACAAHHEQMDSWSGPEEAPEGSQSSLRDRAGTAG